MIKILGYALIFIIAVIVMAAWETRNWEEPINKCPYNYRKCNDGCPNCHH